MKSVITGDRSLSALNFSADEIGSLPFAPSSGPPTIYRRDHLFVYFAELSTRESLQPTRPQFALEEQAVHFKEEGWNRGSGGRRKSRKRLDRSSASRHCWLTINARPVRLWHPGWRLRPCPPGFTISRGATFSFAFLLSFPRSLSLRKILPSFPLTE